MGKTLRERLVFFLRSLFNRRAKEREMQLEMEEHVELRIEELEVQGLPSKEARRKALVEFGGVDQLKEDCRESWGIMIIDGYLKDLKFAFRMIFKHKLFSVVSILTLSIGMGAFISYFTLIDLGYGNVLPIKEPDRLYLLEWNVPGNDNDRTLTKNEIPYLDSLSSSFESRSHTFSFEASIRSDSTHARKSPVLFQSSEYADHVGVYPNVGRKFLDHDFEPDGVPVAIMSHRMATELYGDASKALGNNLWVDSRSYNVVGIMPEGFSFPGYTSLWLPIRGGEMEFSDSYDAAIILKLGLGVNSKRAKLECRALGERLMADFPTEILDGSVLGLRPLQDVFLPKVAVNMIRLVYVGLGLFLCLTCANVSTLMLSRAAQREHELAIRSALGASGTRIIAQSMIESLALTLSGLLLGTLLSLWFSELVISFVETKVGIPISISRSYDWSYYALFLGVVAFVTTLCGWAPARRAASVEATNVLHGDSRGSNKKLGRMSRLLSSAQIAIGCGLLIGLSQIYFLALPALLDAQLEFDAKNVLSVGMEPVSGSNHREYLKQVKAELESSPAIDTVSYSDGQLMRSKKVRIDRIPDRDLEAGAGQKVARMIVGLDYFRVFDLELAGGREFDERDMVNSEPVAIVNRHFAEKYFPGEDPIGKQFFQYKGEGEKIWMKIVGIAPEMQMAGHMGTQSVLPGFYAAAAQRSVRGGYLSVKPSKDRAAAVKAIREILARLNPNQPLDRIVGAMYHIDLDFSIMRGITGIVFSLLCIAMFLASIGIFGMMRFSVRQRTKEFGVRLAIGASRGQLSRSILLQGIKQIAVGLFFGVIIGMAAKIVLSLAHSDFSATRSETIIQTLTGLALFALISSVAIAIPAKSALRIQPMEALRHD